MGSDLGGRQERFGERSCVTVFSLTVTLTRYMDLVAKERSQPWLATSLLSVISPIHINLNRYWCFSGSGFGSPPNNGYTVRAPELSLPRLLV